MTDTQLNNKRIAKNTLLLYIRMLFLIVVSLYTSRVVLKALGIEDFGIYNVVGGVVMSLSFFNSAMAGATQRFLSFSLGKGDHGELKRTFSTCVVLHLGIAVLFLLLAETVGLWFLNNKLVIPDNRMIAANWVFQFSLVTFLVSIVSVPYNAAIIAHEKMSAFAYISILEVLFKLCIAYGILYTSSDKLIFYGLALCLVSVIIRVIYGVYCNKYFIETATKIEYDKTILWDISKYVGWSFYANFSGVAYGQGLNMLLNIFFGPSVNAARAVAYQVQNAVLNFTTSFQMAVNPQIVKYYALHEMQDMYKLIMRSSRFSFYLMFTISLPLWLFLDYILEIWLGKVPDNSVLFCRIVLLIMLVDTLSNPLTTATQSTGNLRLNSLLGGTNLIMILPVSYLFLKWGFPPATVFYVNLFFSFSALAIRLFINKRLMSFPIIDFVYKVLIRCFILGLAISIIPLYVNSQINRTFASLMLMSFLCLCLSVAVFSVFGLTTNERAFINSKFSFYRKKICSKY